MAGARHGIGAALFELHALFVARPRSRGARVETMSAVAVAPVVAPQTASRAVSSRPARGARWGRVGPPGARRAFSFPVDAPGGGASTSPAPPAVPPPRGEGSAAAALQAADSWRDVLAASTLVVLPDEESVAWQRQRIHRKRRAGGAARALGRIARWLAARDKLGAGGEREQCVNDARFAEAIPQTRQIAAYTHMQPRPPIASRRPCWWRSCPLQRATSLPAQAGWFHQAVCPGRR